MSAVKINGIPVFDAVLRDDEDGMLKVSLVDCPAVMSDFQVFKAQERPQLFAVEDEEKRLLLGVVMRADFPIYRVDVTGQEFYMVFKADTIRAMAEKYLLENRAGNVNQMHKEGSDVEGVEMVQFFLKDTAKGVTPAGFDDIADGSLFAEYHVLNDDVWAQVKDGTFKGFSLEGYFGLSEEKDKGYVEDIVDETGGEFRSMKFTKKRKNMSKIEKIKAALAKWLAEFASITTDKGVLVWDGDEDLKVGDEVFVQGETAEDKTTAEDGEYVTEDGSTIVVAGGKVSEIQEPKEGEEEKKPDETEVEAGEEDKPDEKKEGEEEKKPEEEEEKGESIEDRVAALEKVMDTVCEYLGIIRMQKETIAKLQARVKSLEKAPAASAAHEEFKKEAEPDCINAKVANAVRLAKALRRQ